jgi:hypothetical protein
MDNSSTHRRPQKHPHSSINGWRSVFLGRNIEICLHQPGCRSFYKAGNSIPPFHGKLRWRSGNRWRGLAYFRAADSIHRHPIHHRNGSGDLVDQDMSLSRNIAAAPAAGTPKIGLWAVLHEIRSDYAQILTSAFLLVNGPGKWSLDSLLLRKPKGTRTKQVFRQTGAVDLPAATAD